MAVRGISDVVSGFARWELRARTAAGEAAAEIAALLEVWAKAEHPWQNRRGHTEASITGSFRDVSEGIVGAVVSADYDAALWLEFARSGKWSWLAGVLDRHSGDIMRVLAKHLGPYGFRATGVGAAFAADAHSAELAEDAMRRG